MGPRQFNAIILASDKSEGSGAGSVGARAEWASNKWAQLGLWRRGPRALKWRLIIRLTKFKQNLWPHLGSNELAQVARPNIGRCSFGNA